jgi:23S rRNA pseudouridine2605 synthase
MPADELFGTLNQEPERIQKILSDHGICSRRGAEKMILDGRITVNGITASLGQKARPGIDMVAVDGVPLPPKEEYVYVALNKPRGYVTTMNDDRGRKTVTSLVAGAGARLYPIGRLDMDSEGLLLLTNDGAFANVVMHPSHCIAKTYEAHVRGDVSRAAAQMRSPMEIDSRAILALCVELATKSDTGGILNITIGEGRNRQIRKMCALCGLEVVLLRRISIGSVKIGSLKTAEWRYLTENERQSFYG